MVWKRDSRPQKRFCDASSYNYKNYFFTCFHISILNFSSTTPTVLRRDDMIFAIHSKHKQVNLKSQQSLQLN